MARPNPTAPRQPSRAATRGASDRGRRPSRFAAARGAIGRWFAPLGRFGRAALSGDKPYVVVLLAVVALAVVLLSGPAQSYLDHRARVEVLELKAEVLETENERLASRADALQDDETIELLAREQQGFIRPGEVPYALVPPEVDRPRITEPRDRPAPEPTVWYERMWGSLQSLFGG
jgi:cell division protein FtsB